MLTQSGIRVVEHQSTAGTALSIHPLKWFVLFIACLLLATSTWMNFASTSFLEADGISHYMTARFALQNPASFTDVWNRPVRILLHVLPAQLGVHGVRAMRLMIALLCGWIAWKAAKEMKLPAATLAAFFAFTQPMLFLHSFSELTELPFALLLGGAFYAYASRRWWLLAVLAGLTPAARPEG